MRRWWVAMAVAGIVGGCAAFPVADPVQVTLADIDSMPSEGLEMRMLVRLRVQNPNDTPVQYDGVYLKLDVLDRTFATGVSDERGTIPRYGEAIVAIPVTVSMLRVAGNVIGMLEGGLPPDRVNYKLEGKLNAPGFGSTHFNAQGEIAMPGSLVR
jgi:LEA14-like dessication related protein